jgi:hypothetical protein
MGIDYEIRVKSMIHYVVDLNQNYEAGHLSLFFLACLHLYVYSM